MSMISFDTHTIQIPTMTSPTVFSVFTPSPILAMSHGNITARPDVNQLRPQMALLRHCPKGVGPWVRAEPVVASRPGQNKYFKQVPKIVQQDDHEQHTHHNASSGGYCLWRPTDKIGGDKTRNGNTKEKDKPRRALASVVESFHDCGNHRVKDDDRPKAKSATYSRTESRGPWVDSD